MVTNRQDFQQSGSPKAGFSSHKKLILFIQNNNKAYISLICRVDIDIQLSWRTCLKFNSIVMFIGSRHLGEVTKANVRQKIVFLFFQSYDPTRKDKSAGNKEKNEVRKLVHKHRQEMKGAMRELRKDTQFLAREKLQEQINR